MMDSTETKRIQTRTSLHGETLSASGSSRIKRRRNADHGNAGMLSFEVCRARGFLKRHAGASKNHAALFEMLDCGNNPALSKVAGVIVRRIKEIETIAVHIVEENRVAHCPRTARCRRRGAFLVMKSRFKVGKANIMSLNQALQFVETFIAIIWNAAGNEAVARRNECRLHRKSPFFWFSKLQARAPCASTAWREKKRTEP